MTKQIYPFLFCFIRELTLYSPLTYTLTSARELKPFTPPRERVLFINTQFSILYTSMYSPAGAASPCAWCL